jgi:GT2 family glycosyltransferase
MSIPVLIVPTLNQPELLRKMLGSIDYPVDWIIIIDNGGVTDEFDEMGRWHIIRPGKNLGVSTSWNLGMKVTPTAPWWLITNDDVTFGPGDLEQLDQCVDPYSNRHYFMLGMAIFAITKYTLSDVGYFDENFHPAYDEDLDWHRRALLVGSERVNPPFTGTHVGSATIYADPSLRRQNGPTHAANDAYYARKWGGHKLGGERFSTPFDRGGHVGDWRLEPERLAAQSWKKE